jgi:hypothetical protein
MLSESIYNGQCGGGGETIAPPHPPFRKGGGSDVSYVQVQRARMACGHTTLRSQLVRCYYLELHNAITI